MKKIIVHEEVESSNQAKLDKTQIEVDKEIQDKIQKRKNESEALKKLLLNLSEPKKNKRKHHKLN